jgi:uncharacterized protein
LAALFLAMAPAAARAAEMPIPPSPATWVTDNAGVLDPATRTALNTKLASYQRSSGHQVIVWIGTTTGDAPLEDWTIRAFTAWKVGRKGLDDGLALFIFMQDHKVRIEVGYGLEGKVTDAKASRIARNEVAARLKSGDPNGAVTAGVDALLAAIGGTDTAATDQDQTGIAWADAIPLILFLLVFGVFFVMLLSARRAMHGMYTIGRGGGMPFGGGFWSSGGSGGFSGGGFGGGFSGGGGMGGGGGASAGW